MKKLIAIIFALTLTGCSNLGEIFVSGTNAAYAVDVNGGSVSNMILKADLNAEERADVIDARDTIRGLRDKFSNAEPASLIMLHVDYLDAKAAYTKVYRVVMNHRSEYTDDEWQAFVDSHQVALELDNAVNKYIIANDMNESSNSFMLYLTAAAKLAVLL